MYQSPLGRTNSANTLMAAIAPASPPHPASPATQISTLCQLLSFVFFPNKPATEPQLSCLSFSQSDSPKPLPGFSHAVNHLLVSVYSLGFGC